MQVFARLKRNFTLLCMGLTGLVLLITCVMAYTMTKQQLDATLEEVFATQFATIETQVRTNKTVSEVQLYKFEQANDVVVVLIDNGKVIHLQSPVEDATRQALLRQAQEQVHFAYPYNEQRPQFSAQTEEAGAYLCQYASFREDNGNWYAVLLFKSLAGYQHELRMAQISYLAIFVVSLALLFVISALLASKAVKPAVAAQREQTEFIAAAGHELKTPLAVVRASGEMLLKDPEEYDEYVQNILAETGRISSLVEDLLLLAGSQAGKYQIRRKDVNLETLLISLYDRFLPLATEKGYSLVLHLPEKTSLPVMKADEERIEQILAALLSNALAYSAPGTEIEILAKAGRKTVMIEVIDHGPGVKPEEKAHIFRRFYSNSPGEESGHFGLGLSIASELAALHGGKLTLKDTPGSGATFCLTLPVR